MPSPRAVVAIREEPHYRRDAFAAGLESTGYKVSCIDPKKNEPLPYVPGRGDAIVVWNRAARADALAEIASRNGAAVLVAENGYLGRDASGHQLYALARDQHLGAGTWWPERLDGAARWQALGLELQPWRQDGGHVLVCGSRGIGAPHLKMPKSWPAETERWLRKTTKREIRVREHPGRHGVHGEAAVPLERDLAGCWAVVIWASSCGLKALLAGVPVLHGLKQWIGAGAASSALADVERPPTPDRARLSMFRRLATAQWTLAEIQRGDPFAHLLPAAR